MNSDPLPGAWLSRYDRMVSQQVVDAVRGRFAAGANPPGLSLTVASEERTGGAPLVENEGVLSKLLGLERVSGAPLMEGSPSPSPPRHQQQQGWQRVRRRWVHPVGAGGGVLLQRCGGQCVSGWQREHALVGERQECLSSPAEHSLRLSFSTLF